MLDSYQQAVEYLTERPDMVQAAWFSGFMQPNEGAPGACLFQAAWRSCDCGCLTMVFNGDWTAETAEMTRAIRSDQRLPEHYTFITPDHLPIFAGWQRRIDQVLGRTPPPLDPRLPAPVGNIDIPEPEAARQLQ